MKSTDEMKNVSMGICRKTRTRFKTNFEPSDSQILQVMLFPLIDTEKEVKRYQKVE